MTTRCLCPPAALLFPLLAAHAASKSAPAGNEAIRVPMKSGVAPGEYEDFLTGFVAPDGKVWGRPVGVTAGGDGSLLVSDDGSSTIRRVDFVGHAKGQGGR